MKKKELDYFEEFIKNADIAVEMGTILKEYTDNFDPTRSDEINFKVHKLENDADKSLHGILNYLIKDFLPPFDREDIIALAHKIDDSVDNIDEVVINLDILDIRSLRTDFKKFTIHIEQCYFKSKEMLDKFRNFKKYDDINAVILEINHYEELGDRLYEKAIKNLYEKETNPIEVLKWSRVYSSLENCFDSCKSVATCVQEILLKNR